MSVTIFQTKTTLFQATKTRSSKSRKIDIFSKGLTHCFCPKMAIFPTFFLGNKSQENVFYDILERKNAFVGKKTKKFKSRKIDFFSEGVNPCFQSKNGHFSNFFIQPIQARKMSFTIFYSKKTPFQAVKTRSSKTRKTDMFPKRLTNGFGPKMGINPRFFFWAIKARKMSFTIF